MNARLTATDLHHIGVALNARIEDIDKAIRDAELAQQDPQITEHPHGVLASSLANAIRFHKQLLEEYQDVQTHWIKFRAGYEQ